MYSESFLSLCLFLFYQYRLAHLPKGATLLIITAELLLNGKTSPQPKVLLALASKDLYLFSVRWNSSARAAPIFFPIIVW
jgi:hypothetical protein